eukprot:scaffold3576_cov170-Amphora_coffeaeformis.AAC.19
MKVSGFSLIYDIYSYTKVEKPRPLILQRPVGRSLNQIRIHVYFYIQLSVLCRMTPRQCFVNWGLFAIMLPQPNLVRHLIRIIRIEVWHVITKHNARQNPLALSSKDGLPSVIALQDGWMSPNRPVGIQHIQMGVIAGR